MHGEEGRESVRDISETGFREKFGAKPDICVVPILTV